MCFGLTLPYPLACGVSGKAMRLLHAKQCLRQRLDAAQAIGGEAATEAQGEPTFAQVSGQPVQGQPLNKHRQQEAGYRSSHARAGLRVHNRTRAVRSRLSSVKHHQVGAGEQLCDFF